jgi:ketosteroid isomerase-like protein
MTEQTTSPASEIFKQALPGIEAGDLSDLLGRCTHDVVFEFPFAPADRRRRSRAVTRSGSIWSQSSRRGRLRV